MKSKNKNQEKNYKDFIQIFESIGLEKNFSIGEILSSLSNLPKEVFLIKEGNARLISEIDNKLTSVSKLSKGEFIGISSLLCGKPIEEVIASENLVVYSIEYKKFFDLYKENLNIKNFCDNNIWGSELLFILKNFPELYKKNLFTSTNLMEEVLCKAKLIKPEYNNLINYFENQQLLFTSYFENDFEIWSEIKTLSQLKNLLQKETKLPLRIISIQNNIAALKLKDVNYQKKIVNRKVNPNKESYFSQENLIEIENGNKLSISGKGQLERTLACFEILSKLMNFPFKKDYIKNSLNLYLVNHKFISLKVCGEIALYHGLNIDICEINSEMVNRIKTPSLIKYEENFAVISENNKEDLKIFVPYQGYKKIKIENLKNVFPNGIETLNLEKTNLTQKNKFGFNWFYPFFKKYKGVLVQILIAGFVIQLLTLANPLLIQIIIDKVISQRSLASLQILGIALLFVTIFEGILSSFKSFLLSDTCNRIDTRISGDVIDHLLGLPLNFFQQRRTGELSSRVSELEKIRNFITSQALTTILDGAFSIIYIAVMFAYSIKLTLISLVVLPIQILLTLICAPIFKKQFRSVAETNAKSQSHLIEILNGIETVKSQNYEIKSKLKWQKLYSRFINKNFEKTITRTIFIQSSQILQKISQLLILWVGAGMVLKGYISIGQLIAFRIISSFVTQPLLRLSNIWQEIQELKISFERLADIINTKKEINEEEKIKILMPKINGLVDFENVNFKFINKQNYLLSGINLSFKPNNFVAIVGQSGSGKSTLMKLIYRLYSPNEGKILIDGFDISKVELTSLRNQIGIVPQEPILFNGTIKDNIALGDEATEKEIIRAAKLACAHDFIMNLPGGYSTIISEKGSTLSGGQRQRITIARALLNYPRILILDEATSSLDYHTERILCENLLNYKNRGSIFFVSHRLSIVKEADSIVVFHKGKIDEIGTHQELIKRKGRYFTLLKQSEEK